jgi:hypothetical protein
MDKVNSFLDNIKERLTNPLFFSFLIAWILYNWDVTLALLWYDPPKTDKGHYDLIKYVSGHTSWWLSIWKPLLSAIAYTVLHPIFKQGIRLLNAWIERIGDKKLLMITRDGWVSGEKYYELKAKVEAKMGEVTLLTRDENAMRAELMEAKEKTEKARLEVEEMRRRLNDTIDKHTLETFPKLLQGLWDVQLSKTIAYRIEIKGTLWINSPEIEGDDDPFEIRGYCASGNKISFAVSNRSPINETEIATFLSTFYELEASKNGRLLEGIQIESKNPHSHVKFRRVVEKGKAPES